MSGQQPLSQLEISGHFYQRGKDTTRLETFVDAAFAFALTLLVISFDAVPQSYNELLIALQAVPAFLFSFSILAMFWIAHRHWSLRFGLDTTFATVVSLALIFVLLVYVYPLRAMTTAAVSAMTNSWVPSEFHIDHVEQVRGLFIVFGIGFFVSNLCLVLLNWHALRRANFLRLTAQELLLTRYEVLAWLIVGGVGLLSLVLALILPDQLVGLGGWVYMGLALVMPVFGVVTSRHFAARFPGVEPSSTEPD
ncbi:MAG: TMEM175 family protein [Pseudomonadota bacterium]